MRCFQRHVCVSNGTSRCLITQKYRRDSRTWLVVHALQDSKGREIVVRNRRNASHLFRCTDSAQDEARPALLTDPVQTIQWGGTLPSPRRLVLSAIAATSIALGGNFLGVTSWLLSLDQGRLAHKSRIDVLIPVEGYKRCIDYDNGYEFQYPSNWLADQALYRRYAERVEKENSLDPPDVRRRTVTRKRGPEPSAAFGPPGSTGEENISVIVAPIREGFKLQNLGSPIEAARLFLENTVAPPGSDRTAHLITATAFRDESGELYYMMDFTVFSPRFHRHNVAVYGSRNGLLYTLNAQCSEDGWGRDQEKLLKAASSFRILNSGAGLSEFPDKI